MKICKNILRLPHGELRVRKNGLLYEVCRIGKKSWLACTVRKDSATSFSKHLLGPFKSLRDAIEAL